MRKGSHLWWQLHPQSGGLPLEASSSPSSSSLSHTRAGSDAFRPSESGWEEAARNNKEQTCRTNNNIKQNLQLDKISFTHFFKTCGGVGGVRALTGSCCYRGGSTAADFIRCGRLMSNISMRLSHDHISQVSGAALTGQYHLHHNRSTLAPPAASRRWSYQRISISCTPGDTKTTDTCHL